MNQMDALFAKANKAVQKFSTRKHQGTITRRNIGGRDEYQVDCIETSTGRHIVPFIRRSIPEIAAVFPNECFTLQLEDTRDSSDKQSDLEAAVIRVMDAGQKLPKAWIPIAIRLGRLQSDGSTIRVVEKPKEYADDLDPASVKAICGAFCKMYPTFFDTSTPQRLAMTEWNTSALQAYMSYHHVSRTMQGFELAFRQLLADQHLHDINSYGKRRHMEAVRPWRTPSAQEVTEDRAARIQRLSVTPSRDLSPADAVFLKTVTTEELRVAQSGPQAAFRKREARYRTFMG